MSDRLAAPQRLELPADRPHPAVRSHHCARVTSRLAPDLTHAVTALGRREAVSPDLVLLATFAVLLHRYSGQDELAIGCPGADCSQVSSGCGAPLPVLQAGFAGVTDFTELLAQVSDGAPATAVDGAVTPPGEGLERACRWGRGLPFQVMFVSQRSTPQARGLAGPRPDAVAHDTRSAEIDLTLSVVADGEALRLHWDYAGARFDRARIADLAEHFALLLQGILESPAVDLARLPLLTAAECTRLAQWNSTATDFPLDLTVVDLFEAQVARTPHAIALVCAGERLSYRELNARANRLAHALIARGVGPDVLVALCVERSLAMVVGLLAILKAGGAYVPLDPEYPAERLAFMLTDSAAAVLLTRRALLARLPASGAATVLADDDAAFAAAPLHNPQRRSAPADLAYCIYTSGSTGRPKGTLLTHLGLANYLQWARAHYDPAGGSGAPVQSSLAFDATITSLYLPLIVGGRVVLIPDGDEIEGLADLLKQSPDFSLIKITPAHLEILNRQLSERHFADAARALILGGEALVAAQLRPWLDHAPKTRLINEYGPTEAVVGCCIYDACGQTGLVGAVPIGRPIANARIYILDRQLQPLPIGVPGELCIAGVGLARGYLNRPELTAERFVEAPLGGRTERIYRTGDLACWRPDGNLEYLGRLDRQVKLRGFRIELGEIESVLTRHPSVREAAVVLHAGPGGPLLAAYLTAAPECSSPAAAQREALTTEIRTWLAARLPEHMIPAAWVLLDALPLTPNGKVDRRALLPPADTAPDAADRESPATPTEEGVAAVWSDLLGRARLGRHEDLIRLGAHSLSAARAAARLHERFGLELRLGELLERPTVAALAAHLDALLAQPARRAATDSIRPLAQADAPVLSLAQERLWLLDALGAAAAYNLPWALRLTGDLDVAALGAALTQVVHRHAVLRTTLTECDGRPSAAWRDAAVLDLPVTDLRRLPADAREEALERLVRAESARPFDLAHDLLLRVRLVYLTAAGGPAQPAEQVLLVVLHHIAADGWSLAVLMRELAVLYSAGVRGAPAPLPPLPIQYSDFAAWQREHLAGAAAAARLARWQTRLAGAPALIELPTDRPRGAARSFHGATLHLRLDGALVGRLAALGAAAGATPFMTLLAAFAVLLARHSGQYDLVVAAPSAGRPRRALEPLIGYFTNTLPLRIDLAGHPTFLELLQRVRDTTQAALTDQDLPFGRLVETLAPPRVGSHDPLVQIAFALQNIPFAAADFEGIAARPLDLDLPGVRAELELHLWERPWLEPPGTLFGEICYSTALFDAATVARLLERFQVLLAAIAADPGVRIGALPLLGAHERRQLLETWNDTATAFAPVPCVQALFEDWADRTPTAPAVLYEDDAGGEHTLDYGTLNACANRLARQLIAFGIGPEQTVGLCLEPSLERLVGLLGVLKAGAAYVPLDPAYPAARLGFLLEDCRPALVLIQASTRDLVAGHGVPVLCLDLNPDLDADLDGPRRATAPADNPPRRVGPDGLAYIVYTSGSTGMPKGVQVEHRGLCNVAQVAVQMFGLRPADRLLQFAAFGFDVASYEIWSAFAAGATLYLASRERMAPGEPLLALLARRRISCLALTPSALRALPVAALPALRVLLLGGEPSPPDLVAAWRHGRQVVNVYGPTEATIWATASPCADPHEPAVIGWPIANTSAYVLDDLGEPAPIGVAGELYLGGVGVARGYHGRPALTRERFVPNPFGPGRLYRTGDRARRRADGQLEFLGRVDRQIKIRGVRVEPGEVEAALCADPRVTAAAVVVREDRPGDRRLVAYVVPAGSEDAGPALRAQLLIRLRTRLPDYLVPAAIIALAALPLTANGKLDTAALPAPTLARGGGGGGGGAGGQNPPRDATEAAVARVWQEVLGVSAVGRDDDFFDLGGHSLLATAIISRLRAELGVGLPLRALFQSRTVARLATLIGVARDAREVYRTAAPGAAARDERVL